MDQNKVYGSYCRQAIADFWGVDPDIINSANYMAIICDTAAKKSGATVLDICIRPFEPQGLTIAVILSESHLTIHCSPELEPYSFMAVDILTCGDVCNPNDAIDFMIEVLKPKEVHRQYIERGIR